MGGVFHPRLINGQWGDPGLIVRLTHHGRRFLFDLPELGAISPRELLRVSHVFVSHTHMDHFVGLDRLVRLMLGRQRLLKIFGPEPICGQVSRRLASYTWNLVTEYRERLQLEVTQIKGQCLETVKLDCGDGFRDRGLREVVPFVEDLLREGGLKVRWCNLDHMIPSVAYCVEEECHVHVMKSRMEEYGLRRGKWITTLKDLIFRGEGLDTLVDVEPPERGPLAVQWLRDNLIRVERGQKIGYVADAAPTDENVERIVNLVKGADILFIEASFLQRDLQIARNKAHLTALIAGQIGSMAQAKRLVPFHFSPKYSLDPKSIIEEVREAFGGRIVGGQFLVRE